MVSTTHQHKPYILATDSNGQVKFVSESAAQVLGCNAEEVVDSPLGELTSRTREQIRGIIHAATLRETLRFSSRHKVRSGLLSTVEVEIHRSGNLFIGYNRVSLSTRDYPTRLMTSLHRGIWNALHHQALTMAELANVLSSTPDSIRQAVLAMRKNGIDIDRQAGRGYFRPDSPPVD